FAFDRLRLRRQRSLSLPKAVIINLIEEIGGKDILQQTWLWRPNLIVFVSNFCIMVLELVAGRIIAPYVGVSLYTWTSVIGIVLAGISLGNYLGGRLADRSASLRMLGLIFLGGGLSSLLILTVNYTALAIPAGWPIIFRILVLITILFFIPATILGMTSPMVAKLAVQDLAKTGQVVGQIYAFGTAGSIAGTFATGFVLISAFGTFNIVWGVAIIITSLGLLFYLDRGFRPLLLFIPLAIGSYFLTNLSPMMRSICDLETNYFCIRIVPDEREEGPVQKLILDRLVHSYNSLDNPLQLTYGYEKQYAEMIEYLDQNSGDTPVTALFIGGGGYTFPRYMRTVLPDSVVDVIEIDPVVTEVAHELLGVDRALGIESIGMDARQFLMGEPIQRYDFIVGDAFDDYSVPYHLTTDGFNQLILNWLTEDGIYMVNLVDGGEARFVRAYVHTLQQSFDYVYLAPTLSNWRDSPRSTFIVTASNQPLDLVALSAIDPFGEGGRFSRNVMSSVELTSFLEEGDVVFLTDQYAPVEQLLAPTFRE
ncbi:MAG: fused MFS/spermidine synthase, partial [Chloroflexota bacterium]